ncbi:putative membrane protein [Arthrobacter sp. UYCu723]
MASVHYLARITEQTPDRKIAWVSTDKPRNTGHLVPR